MRYLLDTHVLLWALGSDERLESRVLDEISDPANEVLVSAASVWEIAIKKALGKLRVPDDLEEQLERSRLAHLPIMVRHALAAGALDPHHRDPFDRMIVAQALTEELTVVTRDPRFADYGVALLPA